MDRLSKGDEHRLRVVATVAVYRGQGGYGEDEIAEKVGFGSAEALRGQLAAWGMPAWFSGYSEGGPRGRRARAGGDASGTPLPPAFGAVGEFAALLRSLEEQLPDLTHREEAYRHGRFETAERVPGDGSGGAWPEAVFPLGAGQFPEAPLPALISLWALSDGDVERLLELLHLEPSRADRDLLDRKLAELRLAASHVARLVRGGEIRRGHHTESLTPEEMAAISYLHHARLAGISEAEARRTLAEKGFAPDDFDRLKDF